MNEDRERGQVLVLTALFMVALLVAAALAIDYSTWLAARRDYQGVVDAAALAGAAELPPTGFKAPSLGDQQNAAAEALVYLNDHLSWGHDRTWAQGEAAGFLTVGSTVHQPDPLVVTAADGNSYCVWVWTPTPAGSEPTGTDPTCHPVASTLYSPANFPSSSHKVFVRVDSLRPSFFSNLAGIHNELVGAGAVAGSEHLNYAVIALKPRLGTPDNVSGLTITGNSTLKVPVGDVGGNFTLAWGGTNSHILFPDPTLEQRVDLEEPGSIVSPGSGSVIGGSVEQLLDYPIPDPGYMAPQPAWCKPPTGGTATPYAAQCQELQSSAAGGSQGVWPWPPSTGGPTGKGVYPACATTTGNGDIANHRIACADSSTLVLYPGMYEYVSIPNSVATVILSPYCYGYAPLGSPYYQAGAPLDTDCHDNGRDGVFYFQSTANTAGLQFNGSGSTMSGCGVFLMFDPNENGGSGKLQFKVPAGNTVNINSDAFCPNGETMKWDGSPGNLSGTMPYRWYGFGSPYLNPVSVWVRPNRNGYDLTGSNSGSHVITMASGSTINENGVIYGPEDNTTVSGGPAGSGVGQIVTWTITYTGGTTINETYQGPGTLRTRLLQ